MLMQLCPGDWKEQLDRKNKKVYEDNGRGGTQDNGRFWKFQRFFKERILEEHWVSSISNYLWTWGLETVGEGSKDKW